MATQTKPVIFYTKTDEAPMIATHSLLPIVQTITKHAGVNVEMRDISLAGRILANLPEYLTPEQKKFSHDALSELGELARTSSTVNIVKLPNISASLPQIRAAVKELRSKGFMVPDPELTLLPPTATEEEKKMVTARFNIVKGSAVNPVLREGNSDRRAPKAVKEYARAHPHSNGNWTKESKTRVVCMEGKGDFFENERSVTVPKATTVRFVHIADTDGKVTVLKEKLPLLAGEILDATRMSRRALVAFLQEQRARAKQEGVLFSLHVKATMMKISDPIIFGHAVRVLVAPAIEKHAAVLAELKVEFNNGLGDLYAKIKNHPKKAEIEADFAAALEDGPQVAMVDSTQGITNFHVPSDVIIDASMPAMIRNSGKMWNKKGALQDTLAVLPDSTYAGIYQIAVDWCREHGSPDPRTMGTVPNVGLMASAAEEYGSHDKTFEMAADGIMRVEEIGTGAVLHEHKVEKGDIWRACQAKDAPIRDWVALAIKRATLTNTPAIFWLDEKRAHDVQVLAKVREYLKEHDTSKLDISIMPPKQACLRTFERVVKGLDTIGVTGNVLRDYLTDLFPILEVSTSAKMLSIVPLMAGGGLFETGAGGSAPKQVQQFVQENYMRWDSTGEFFALVPSLEHAASAFKVPRAQLFADCLDIACGKFLENNRSPGRALHTIDNRGSHFYIALYWTEALAAQKSDPEIAARFAPVAAKLAENEKAIVAELDAVQGKPCDMGGYYWPDTEKLTAIMRPSATFNKIMAMLE